MSLINIHDEEEMFGLREVEDIGSPVNSGSDAEDNYDDDVPEAEAQPDQPQQPINEATDTSDPSAVKIIKPKRVIKNPQPKFDAARLCGPRGIGVVQKFLSDAPYRGKGYEAEDLGLLLQKLKHWAHRLYPKLPFLDSIAQIEKLGNKKAVQVNVKRLRLDMYDVPKENQTQEEEEDDDVMRVGDSAPADVDEPDVFDELLRQSGTALPLQERIARNAAAPPTQPMALSMEQKERIERSRQLALQRQRAKIASASLDTSNTVEFTDAAPSNCGEVVAPTTPGATGDRKRTLSQSEQLEDESIQPTQEEVRKLREKLLDSVLSQKEASTNSGNNNENQTGDVFGDDDDLMNIDEIMAALKNANKLEKDIPNDQNCLVRAVHDGPHIESGQDNIANAISSNAESVDSNSNAPSDAEGRTSASRENETTASLLGSHLESDDLPCSGFETSLSAVGKTDESLSQESQVVLEPQSPLEKRPSQDPSTLSTHRVSSEENQSRGYSSSVLTDPEEVAKSADSAEELPFSNTSTAAGALCTDSELLGKGATLDLMSVHSDNIENMDSEDCNVSR